MDGYRIAEGFFLYNNVVSVLSIVISFAISWLALKTYRLTKHRSIGVFSLAFLLIGISYGFLFTPILLHAADFAPMHAPPAMPWGLFVFALLYLAGVILLLSTTIKVWQTPIPFILMLICIVGLIMVPWPIIAVHIFSIIFFMFIAIYYLKNYLKHREASTFIVFGGFLFLLAGNVILVFAGRDSIFFSLGRIAELLGYLAFLVNLWLVLRK